jgi:hypothetical protein
MDRSRVKCLTKTPKLTAFDRYIAAWALNGKSMRRLLLATTALIALAIPANAGARGASDTGTGTPASQVLVILTSNTQFFLQNNAQQTVTPTYLFFLRPDGTAAPTVSSILFNSGVNPAVTFGPVTDLSVDFNSSSGDVYTFLSKTFPVTLGALSAGNNSISFGNISDAFDKAVGGHPTSFAFTKSINTNGILNGNKEV